MYLKEIDSWWHAPLDENFSLSQLNFVSSLTSFFHALTQNELCPLFVTQRKMRRKWSPVAKKEAISIRTNFLILQNERKERDCLISTLGRFFYLRWSNHRSMTTQRSDVVIVQKEMAPDTWEKLQWNKTLKDIENFTFLKSFSKVNGFRFLPRQLATLCRKSLMKFPLVWLPPFHCDDFFATESPWHPHDDDFFSDETLWTNKKVHQNGI